ncbi:glutamate/aspartate ABC transporter ATP-binding protein [Escherichia coli]|nr:glutamate/aspartate ABC transporter ATP-binding protein [Escherichia coli]
MITLKNVSKWYGHFQVLTDCSTEVKKGEVVVVCGPSGSGKSTLIKTVNGLEPVQQGEITVDGIVVNDKKPIWRNCVPASGWCFSISSCSPICRLSKPDPGAGESA